VIYRPATLAALSREKKVSEPTSMYCCEGTPAAAAATAAAAA